MSAAHDHNNVSLRTTSNHITLVWRLRLFYFFIFSLSAS